ncbi:coproporphyrinogen III oxidase [Peribacillus sp. SCS-155]|uniref:coproporphyrinogen III oxidase n=1 Tax=Peribacillus sedimenti TaxID=3115297 RepID=UPI003905E45F
MKLAILGLDDERFHRPLQNIANLFFEDSDLVMAQDASAELTAEISYSTSENSVTAFVRMVEHTTGAQFHSEHTRAFSQGNAEKETFKEIKRAISYVLVNVLEELTGIKQKWGILTGVRPTKLMHQKVQAGIGRTEALEQLQKDYMISKEKVELMQKIVDRQLAVVPDLYNLKNEVSIYIGIPFCPTKCAYCTFPAYAINGRQGSVDSFLGGLHYEIREMGRFLKERNIRITTIYYGGGTPTSITAEEMDMLYEEMYAAFPDVEKVREITVEAGRPDTITPEKLEILKKWNIDRISVNPQSYTQETLKAIGRHHTVEETIEKFHLSRKMGMNNINMDLIIGLPGEELPEFTHTLNETEKLMPESLTVHTLSFKRASEMTRNKQKYKVAARDEAERMMNAAEKWTAGHGYNPYYLYRMKNILGNLENVGYSIPGQESIYNIMIMEELQSIIGLGCGASSKFIDPHTGKITHFANPKDPKSYNDNFEHYTHKKIEILKELFSVPAAK